MFIRDLTIRKLQEDADDDTDVDNSFNVGELFLDADGGATQKASVRVIPESIGLPPPASAHEEPNQCEVEQTTGEHGRSVRRSFAREVSVLQDWGSAGSGRGPDAMFGFSTGATGLPRVPDSIPPRPTQFRHSLPQRGTVLPHQRMLTVEAPAALPFQYPLHNYGQPYCPPQAQGGWASDQRKLGIVAPSFPYSGSYQGLQAPDIIPPAGFPSDDIERKHHERSDTPPPSSRPALSPAHTTKATVSCSVPLSDGLDVVLPATTTPITTFSKFNSLSEVVAPVATREDEQFHRLKTTLSNVSDESGPSELPAGTPTPKPRKRFRSPKFVQPGSRSQRSRSAKKLVPRDVERVDVAEIAATDDEIDDENDDGKGQSEKKNEGGVRDADVIELPETRGREPEALVEMQDEVVLDEGGSLSDGMDVAIEKLLTKEPVTPVKDNEIIEPGSNKSRSSNREYLSEIAESLDIG